MQACTTQDIRKAGLVKINVYNVETGEVETVERNLDVVIRRLNEGVENFIKIGKYSVIGEFFNGIIWTFRTNTACTDGIRLYFNPLFANELLSLGGPGAIAKKDEMTKAGATKKAINEAFTFEAYKYFLFVIIHECYHQIYRHIESAQFKEETKNGKNHQLANIAMDDQINRDIEEQWPEFKGCTEKSNGCIEAEKYPVEIWDEIFDDKYKNGEVIPPPPPPSAPGKSGGDDEDGDDDSEVEHQTAAKDYADGWAQAIADIKSGKINPKTFKPLPVNKDNFDHEVLGFVSGVTQFDIDDNLEMMLSFNQDEWNQGYNDCIAQALQQGGGGGQQPGGTKTVFDNLEDPPMLNPQQGGGGKGNGEGEDGQDSDDSNQNGSKGNQQGSGTDDGNDNQNGQDGSQGGSDGSENGQDDSQSGGSGKGGSTGTDPDQRGNTKGQGSDGTGEDGQDGNQQGQSQNGQGQGKNGQGQRDNGVIPKPMKQRSELGDGETGSRADETGGGEVFQVSKGDTWGNGDLISKEEGMKISAEEGEPYTDDEMNDTPEEHAKRVIKHNEQKIKDIGKGTNAPMERILAKINEILAPSIVDWRTVLAGLFKNAGIKQNPVNKMKKSRFSQNRLDKYDLVNPTKRPELAKTSADIFYLVDSSGSIGKRELYRTFSEVIDLETRPNMNIRKSAFTYFANDFDESRIRVWAREDKKTKKMELIQYVDGEDVGGGTEIAGSVVHVTKLPKKFYSTSNPHTLIIVFTDGEDFSFDKLATLPEGIRRRIVFVIMNNSASRITTIAQQIAAQGIADNHIIGIDITKDLFKN